ncbi:hypothetical protein Tco_0424958 [Tanacetum coccineum]
MDDPNITMEEYIRLEEEKDRKRGKVFNWKTAKYGKIWYDKDFHDLRSVETEFPSIVFNDNLTSNETLFCEPTVSSLNNNEIDFRISFDESDDEDYTVVFDKNSFSYKIIYANDLKTDSKNDNEKVNMPLFPSPEPSVSYKTSLSEYDEVEQNILYFNDLFHFNIIYPVDLKSDKDNDDNEIDMIQYSKGNENTQGSNNLLEGSHDKINKVFIMKSFAMELNVNIVAWNYLVNGMLLNLIKNLYVSFGIPFDPQRYYKDGDCTRMLWRPRVIRHMAPLPPRDQRHLWLCYQVEGYTKEIDLAERLRMVYTRDDGQELGGARRSMIWRQFILALGLHTAEEMTDDGFGEYWLGSERMIHDKGDLSDYWVEISFGRDFLRGAPSYTYIRDPLRRLCHMLISYIISKRGQAPEKVTATDLFYLRRMDRGAANVLYLLAQYLFRRAEGRKSGARIIRCDSTKTGSKFSTIVREYVMEPSYPNQEQN